MHETFQKPFSPPADPFAAGAPHRLKPSPALHVFTPLPWSEVLLCGLPLICHHAISALFVSHQRLHWHAFRLAGWLPPSFQPFSSSSRSRLQASFRVFQAFFLPASSSVNTGISLSL